MLAKARSPQHSRSWVSLQRSVVLVAFACFVALGLASSAAAAQLPVSLGTSDTFAVLAGSTVTNAGFSTLNGDLGVSPGSAFTGFPPGTVNGTTHSADPVAAQAQADLTAAYNDAAGRTPPIALPADVGGRTLTPGVYKADPALGLTGTLTLDGQGDPNAVFVFQVGSALTTAVSSRVNLINGAQAGNVFWQIGSSATLGTSSVFAGTIMALSSISMNNGVAFNGRALARNGAVTLINDTVTAPQITSRETKPPAVDAAGDLQDLADDYVGGQATPSLAVLATDDLSGVAHLGVSEVGNTELAGTDLDCGIPRTCDLDVDGSFPVKMASLSSGKHTLQATARDDGGNVGVSSPWAVYVDREAPGLATGFGATATTRSVGASSTEAGKRLAQRASGSNTDVYWTDPDDPDLSDGSPGAGVSTYSYRYHVGAQAWSAWTASDSPDFSLSSAALGSSVSLEVRSIDAVGNIGAVSSATVTVTAGDSSVSRGFVGESGGTSRAAGASVRPIFYCTFSNNLIQTRLGTGRNDTKNAVRATGSATCYNRADPDPRKPDIAEVKASHYSLRVCIRSVEGVFGDRELKCTHFTATAPLLPTPLGKVNTMPTISDVCRTGTHDYKVVTHASYHGPIRDQIPTSQENKDVTAKFGPFRCNEPGAWRYLARRGAGSASNPDGARNASGPGVRGR